MCIALLSAGSYISVDLCYMLAAVQGGESRKGQMADEHEGDASAGYSEMGSKGGQA